MYTRHVFFPGSDGKPFKVDARGNCIVVIGANGAGKSRLGAWIELCPENAELSHRITAQKSLRMINKIVPASIDIARDDLLYGRGDPDTNQKWRFKTQHRYGNTPSVPEMNDYTKLLVYLFSENAEACVRYAQDMKCSSEGSAIERPPVTKLDKVVNIWSSVLPHRKLSVGAYHLKVDWGGGYKAAEMSDGERVVFYLIGQCLSAPDDGIIIVDEPELHLNSSIKKSLWSQLMEERSDCVFIFLTHDVDFAVSLKDSTKLWARSYDGQYWSLEEIKPIDSFPEQLLLEIMGSRNPVIFVEGDSDSYDLALYRLIFSEFLVVPSGSCTHVIQYVKALRGNNSLHHLKAYGIIDRDRRGEEEVSSLKKNGIYVLGVAEVENLFCTEELLMFLSSKLSRNPEEDFEKISNYVLRRLSSEKEVQASKFVFNDIKYSFMGMEEKAVGGKEIERYFIDHFASIKVDSMYELRCREIDEILSAKDYRSALKIYNRKSISSEISGFLGLKNDELIRYAIRVARGADRAAFVSAIMPYMGGIDEIF